MNEVTETIAPAGYRLGDPIALEDLLALPADGRRYTRDAEGRLALMSPDNARRHRYPLSALTGWLWSVVRPPAFVAPEPGVAFERIRTLQGRLLPRSRLGVKTLEPDVVVFGGPPRFIEERGFDARDVALVVEVLSPSTHRQDLGLGAADEVDRLRSFLESGAPEYWVLNPTTETLALPPRTGLFLRAEGGRWAPLDGDALAHGEGQVHGFRPVASGRVRSRALGVEVDLAAMWERLTPPS
jgi:Uma2 family endonuclease